VREPASDSDPVRVNASTTPARRPRRRTRRAPAGEFRAIVPCGDWTAVRPRNSAPAAPSPTPAAAATSAAPAAAPTTATAATATAATATTATAAPSYLLQAGSALLPVEQMERGETDVGHLLIVQNEALFGPVVVRLRDISGGHCRCGCAPRQRKPQSDGTERRRGNGFGRAVLSPSLFPPCHGCFPRYVQVDIVGRTPTVFEMRKRRRRFLFPRDFFNYRLTRRSAKLAGGSGLELQPLGLPR
jgi:hypothetical protein